MATKPSYSWNQDNSPFDTSKRTGGKKMVSSKGIAGMIAAGLVTLIGSCAAYKGITTVPAGHVVVLDTFGKVDEEELKPGLHMTNLFAKRIEMDVRTKELKEPLNVPTSDGVIAGLDISILYHVDPQRASNVYQNVGPEFEKIVIEPKVRNVGRDIVANHKVDELYSASRGTIASDIKKNLEADFGERGIILEEVLLRDIRLPDAITNQINAKIAAKVASEQMEYVIDKEKKEKERKLAEAEGISKAQEEITKGLTTPYLQWRFIEALMKMAESPNKVFVVTPYNQGLIPTLPLDGN